MANSAPTPTAATPSPGRTKGFVIACQCDNVRLETHTDKPLGFVHCHCTECRRQSGSAFGTSVYFPPAEGFFPLPPNVASRVGSFTRTTDSGNTMHCYFCKGCGVRLLHAVYLGEDGSLRKALSVKGGCIEDPEGRLDWSKAKHIFTRSAVMPLAPGWETYETLMPAAPATESK